MTAGVEDRREQARLLHDWVSLRICYVALYLGRGGVEGHTAEAMMDAGYGDCKDNVVLLGALLDAKGIPNGAALVNLGNAYSLSGPPTLAQLNHVITYLPDWNIYTDSTLGAASFGVLPLEEQGKLAVHVGVPGQAVRKLPMGSPDSTTVQVRTNARLLEDGVIEGMTETVASGTFTIPLRLAARAIQSVDQARVSEAQLRSLGQTGTGSIQIGSLEYLEPEYSIKANFTLEARPELMDGEAFAPPVGLQMLRRTGDVLLDPLHAALSDQEPTPCFADRQQEELTLELPKGRAPARLPAPRRIKKATFTYSSRWSLEDGPDKTKLLRAVRTIESKVATPVCEGELRRKAATALREIRRDHSSLVSLALAPE